MAKLFDGLKFCLELPGESFKTKTELKSAIEGAGGTVSPGVYKDTNFMVATLGALEGNTARVKMATKLGVSTVEREFVTDCLSTNTVVDIWAYSWIAGMVALRLTPQKMSKVALSEEMLVDRAFRNASRHLALTGILSFRISSAALAAGIDVTTRQESSEVSSLAKTVDLWKPIFSNSTFALETTGLSFKEKIALKDMVAREGASLVVDLKVADVTYMVASAEAIRKRMSRILAAEKAGVLIVELAWFYACVQQREVLSTDRYTFIKTEPALRSRDRSKTLASKNSTIGDKAADGAVPISSPALPGPSIFVPNDSITAEPSEDLQFDLFGSPSLDSKPVPMNTFSGIPQQRRPANDLSESDSAENIFSLFDSIPATPSSAVPIKPAARVPAHQSTPVEEHPSDSFFGSFNLVEAAGTRAVPRPTQELDSWQELFQPAPSTASIFAPLNGSIWSQGTPASNDWNSRPLPDAEDSPWADDTQDPFANFTLDGPEDDSEDDSRPPAPIPSSQPPPPRFVCAHCDFSTNLLSVFSRHSVEKHSEQPSGGTAFRAPSKSKDLPRPTAQKPLSSANRLKEQQARRAADIDARKQKALEEKEAAKKARKEELLAHQQEQNAQRERVKAEKSARMEQDRLRKEALLAEKKEREAEVAARREAEKERARVARERQEAERQRFQAERDAAAARQRAERAAYLDGIATSFEEVAKQKRELELQDEAVRQAKERLAREERISRHVNMQSMAHQDKITRWQKKMEKQEDERQAKKLLKKERTIEYKARLVAEKKAAKLKKKEDHQAFLERQKRREALVARGQAPKEKEDLEPLKLFVGGIDFQDLRDHRKKNKLTDKEYIKLKQERIKVFCRIFDACGDVRKRSADWDKGFCHVVYRTPDALHAAYERMNNFEERDKFYQEWSQTLTRNGHLGELIAPKRDSWYVRRPKAFLRKQPNRGSADNSTAPSASNQHPVTSFQPHFDEPFEAPCNAGHVSLVCMPPPTVWRPIVELKRNHMKPSIKRPPYPHITLLQPFVQPEATKAASALIARALANFPHIRLLFKEFKIFRNKTSATLYLEPEVIPAGALDKLQRAVGKLFPQAVYKFEAHIGVGFFQDAAEAERCREAYQWAFEPFEMTITELYVMHHETETRPFSVREIIPIGHNSPPSKFRIGDNTLTIVGSNV